MKEIVKILKALSDETRLRIINLLLESELCVCEMVDILQIPQYQVSRHLGILKWAGLVEDRREGTWMYYSIPLGRDELADSLVKAIKANLKDEITKKDIERAKKRLSLRLEGKCVLGYQGIK